METQSSETQVEIVPGHVFNIDSTCIVGVSHFNEVQRGDSITFINLGGPDNPLNHSKSFEPGFERFRGLYIAYQVLPEAEGLPHRVLCKRGDGDKETQILLAFCEGHLIHAHQPWDENEKRRNEALNPIGMARKVLVLNVPAQLERGPHAFHDAGDSERASHLYATGQARFYRTVGGAGLGETLVLQRHGKEIVTLATEWELDESTL